MREIHFNPGCALSIYKPDAETRILKYLNAHYGDTALHKICCRHAPCVRPGALIVNVCAGCDRRFGSLYEGVSTISLWEVVDTAGHFNFPDYAGLSVSVHDACPVREKPQVHAAVRSLLAKMNVRIVETEFHGTRSVCCGDDLYPRLPAERVRERMKARAEAMPCADVAVYCVSCIKSMSIGGRTPRHLVDLLFGEPTEPGDTDTIRWHETLQRYIDAH